MVNTKITLAVLMLSFLIGQWANAQEPNDPTNNNVKNVVVEEYQQVGAPPPTRERCLLTKMGIVQANTAGC
ncbi:hypothetical protein [Candidatus Odyssella acanthamoebae]|uniref:Uncharacterized protein n=1 Tax=Candidatus Odyssella acanthamoebae TaxID=91604 RepID=A0A077B2M0_9PROT|nr:hypothetical protein [Candidatus Paracaedibacter acanthamoebae]AIK97250.1 hypothetical protein ID47_11690 [Candidatus Paracaedibacter acanthamoebae]